MNTTDIYILGLAFECPYSNKYQRQDCACKDIRALAPAKRIKILKETPGSEKQEIIEKHRTCILDRLLIQQ